MKSPVVKFLYVWFVSVACLCAQQAGVLAGRITGVNGSGVANASVSITNTATNVSQKVLTAADGSFSISGLQPGSYRVDVEMAGFRTTEQTLTLGPGTSSTVNLNLTIQPGNANEIVEVNGTSPATQDNNAQLGVGLGMRPLQELPVVDRNHQQLAGLEPGITPPDTDENLTLDPDRTRVYSSDGQSPFLNQYYSTGLLNQEPVRGTAIRVIPEEAVEQTNLTVANPTMNEGFTGGALFMDNVRAGTNGLHGSLFEFWNGDALDTRNYFDSISNQTPRLTYNQFGGTAGGAIRHDRTFLFGSYEGSYQRGDQIGLSTVPLAGAAMGNFSAIPGISIFSPTSGTTAGVGRSAFLNNTIPSYLINPTSAAIAGFIPSPNLPGLVDNYASSLPFQNDYQKADARLDHRIGEHTNLFLGYGYSNDHALTESPIGPVIGSGTSDRLVAQNASIGATSDFGPHLTSELRFGYNRYDQKVGFEGDETALGNSLGITGFGNSLASIQIPGMPAIGEPAYLPENPIDNTFNWVWSWSYVTSHHHFQWGVDVRRLRSDGFLDSALSNQFGLNGGYFFGPGATLANNGTPLAPYSEFYNSYAAFLLGAPSQAGAGAFLTNPSYRQGEYGGWVGDTIQVMRHITADVGVRYDVFTPLFPDHAGDAVLFNPTANTLNYAGIGGYPKGLTNWNWGNVAPRIGIAAHVTSKTVIRAGYSIQYFEMPYMFSGMMTPMTGFVSGVPGGYSVAPLTNGFTPTLTVPAATGFLTNGMAASDLPVSLVPRNMDTSSVQDFHLQVQQQFLWGTVLSAGYAGALGRHLLGISELNESLPGTGVAGLPFESLGRTGSVLGYNDGYNSNYNALQVSLARRFVNGLSFLGSYTYSKALGYTNMDNMILDPYNLRANYGPMDWDRQQVLSISHLWELPFLRHGNSLASTILGGWQLNGIFSWATGTPLTFTADPLLCNCVNAVVLASATGPIGTTGNYGLGQEAVTGSFAAPTGSTSGNLARGVLRGPGIENYDLSLFKNFHVHERFNMQVRGEAYNLFNSPRLMNPVTNINAADFGQIVAPPGNTLNGAFGRQINLALRFQF
ncbi:MAG TPA: TonB-dependent receptor [Bryobacteraceae bacterium]|nr:TonB-dependent receptor [Bryobacteraceae bacterium]